MFTQGLIDKPVKVQRFVGCAAPGNNPKGIEKVRIFFFCSRLFYSQIAQFNSIDSSS